MTPNALKEYLCRRLRKRPVSMTGMGYRNPLYVLDHYIAATFEILREDNIALLSGGGPAKPSDLTFTELQLLRALSKKYADYTVPATARDIVTDIVSMFDRWQVSFLATPTVMRKLGR